MRKEARIPMTTEQAPEKHSERYRKKALSWLEYEQFLKASRSLASGNPVKTDVEKRESLFPKVRFTF